MNRNKKNGVSLLMLVITIVIALILFTVITMSYNNVITSTKQREFANEIHNLQNLVDQYYFMNDKYPVTDSSAIEFDLSTLKSRYKLQFSSEPDYQSGVISLQELDLVEVGADNITRGLKKDGNANDIYVVSPKTGIVYYLAGQEIDGDYYYTLTDDLKDKLDI